ncbi:MAG: hypothetical protein A4E73_02611 [Syntrophaceae bacterium PtaU1.Bin231]|nr:MAG: hypothetical protein A4E73_02611 [Syntrophaceae bacterium PtaU1.Bin231]
MAAEPVEGLLKKGDGHLRTVGADKNDAPGAPLGGGAEALQHAPSEVAFGLRPEPEIGPEQVLHPALVAAVAVDLDADVRRQQPRDRQDMTDHFTLQPTRAAGTERGNHPRLDLAALRESGEDDEQIPVNRHRTGF